MKEIYNYDLSCFEDKLWKSPCQTKIKIWLRYKPMKKMNDPSNDHIYLFLPLLESPRTRSKMLVFSMQKAYIFSNP